MPKISNKDGNINIEDIYVDVQCESCRNSYSVKMDKPSKIKNCHCGSGTFLFTLSSTPGYIVVNVEFRGQDYEYHPVTPLKVYLYSD